MIWFTRIAFMPLTLLFVLFMANKYREEKLVFNERGKPDRQGK